MRNKADDIIPFTKNSRNCNASLSLSPDFALALQHIFQVKDKNIGILHRKIDGKRLFHGGHSTTSVLFWLSEIISIQMQLLFEILILSVILDIGKPCIITPQFH